MMALCSLFHPVVLSKSLWDWGSLPCNSGHVAFFVGAVFRMDTHIAFSVNIGAAIDRAHLYVMSYHS